jgi:hypothetical protein
MRVEAAGQSADFSFDTTGNTLADIGWESRHWSFTATDTTTMLEFYSLGPPEVFGPVIDNIEVSPALGVPLLPGAIPVLVLIGALCAGVLRLQRLRALPWDS